MILKEWIIPMVTAGIGFEGNRWTAMKEGRISVINANRLDVCLGVGDQCARIDFSESVECDPTSEAR